MSMALLGPSGRVALEAPVYTLGSAPDNQLVFHDPRVSPRHAALQLQGQQYSIIDLGSFDGTYLNEQRLASNTPVFLKNGDRIRIGNTQYTFEMALASASAFPPTVMAGSSPSYDPTVQAQQAPATPAFGQSNPGLPPYGQAQQPPATPMYGQSNPGLPSYGQAAPATPAYGQPAPSAFEQAQQAPATPAFGQSNPGLPPYGQAAPAAPYGQSSSPGFPSYGQSNVSSPGYPGYIPPDPNAPTAAYTPAPGQPYMPAPGQLYPPPAQPQKKGGMKALVISLIIILVLALVGGGIFYIVNLPQPTISITSQYQDGPTPAGASVSTSATTFKISGKRFSHNSTITFLLDNATLPGGSTAQSDGDGNLGTTTLTVTKDWSVGKHTITAKDASNYVTKTGVSVSIVTAGQDKTPGPNGAPTDTANGTISATIQNPDGSTTPMTLNVNNGKVCGTDDNGQSQTRNGTLSDGSTVTETITNTCSGTYKGGALSYTETVTSDSFVFTSGPDSGVSCTAQTPYVAIKMTGNFTDATTINGSTNSDAITLTCKIGSSNQTIPVSAQTGTWDGKANMG